MKILLLITAGILGGFVLKDKVPVLYQTIPLQVTTEASMPTPTPTPSKSEVIAYIAKTFEKEGTAVQVQAINCFYSESGLRWDALHVNTNGTHDGGVSQLNSVHKLADGDLFNYKKNIDYAHDMFIRQGWRPWYGKLCN